MIHILFVMHSVSLYGASRSAIDLASELQKLGQKVFFFIPLEGRVKERCALKKTSSLR